MPVNVCIARCDDYSADSVAAAFDRVLEPLGGIDWVQPGMTVAIKTNLVSRMSPDTAAVTHPTLLAELTSRLTARGARVIVGDSPGGPYTAAWVHSVYNGTLMEAVVKARRIKRPTGGRSRPAASSTRTSAPKRSGFPKA